jgi:amino acid transporter
LADFCKCAQLNQSLELIPQFIVVSGTIGLGLFVDSGEILRIAGPGGALFVICLVGVGVIFLMAGVAEMINHWPISGALVEFVRTFVDEELGFVLGIAYWCVFEQDILIAQNNVLLIVSPRLAYSITFGTLLSALVDLGRYWNWPGIWQVAAFCIASPFLILFINVNSVYVGESKVYFELANKNQIYGFIESIAGALKLLLVFGSLVTMLVINNAGIALTFRFHETLTDRLELGGEPKIGSKCSLATIFAEWQQKID